MSEEDLLKSAYVWGFSESFSYPRLFGVTLLSSVSFAFPPAPQIYRLYGYTLNAPHSIWTVDRYTLTDQSS